MKAAVTTESEPQGGAALSEGARTLVSFLLFVHLFAIATGLIGQFWPRSPLRTQLAEVVGLKQYREILFLDMTSYGYHYTYNTDLDFDHLVEVEMDWKQSGPRNDEKLTLPDPGASLLRRERYRNLLYHLADHIGAQDESRLPAALGRMMLADAGVVAGKHRLRCLRHEALSMAQARSPDARQRDPFDPERYATAYEADLSFVRGQLAIVKVTSALESAPVERNP